MKIANWNIEWMNRWYSPDREEPVLRPSHEIGGVTDVRALCERVARIIDGLGADVITVQEGPSRRAEMQLFVSEFLGDGYSIIGPSGTGAQKLYALVRNDGAAEHPARVDEPGEIRFEDPFMVDVDGNLELQAYEITREPLLLEVTDADSGRRIHIVNLHLKSKYVHLGARMWRDPATRPDFVREAMLARRRISAEAMQVRRYLDELLEADLERAVIVAGDFNDGPGSDYFERHYLTHNLAAMLAGNPFDPPKMFRHGFIDRETRERNYTAVFDDFIDEIDDRKILLDHILCSPGMYWDLQDGRVEHDVFDAQIDSNADADSRQRLPSDHRPQSATFLL